MQSSLDALALGRLRSAEAVNGVIEVQHGLASELLGTNVGNHLRGTGLHAMAKLLADSF